MKKNVKLVRSIADLLKHLKKDRGIFKDQQVWFRGQSEFNWKLRPSFMRGSKGKTEITLITRFKQNAALLIDKLPINYFDWLFQMQHHGVPTRLLDWTESALTALYFAVENEKHFENDGAFWILLPTELNKYANIDSDEANYIPSFEDVFLENYNPQSLHREKISKLLPVAAIASRNNTRMQAQLGVFTISHRDETPIEDIGNKKHILKYKIPASMKKKIKDELATLGITKFQIFPELSSIGEIIKNDF